jgi:tetratricopeptide (TPR) repeat protein
MTPKEAVAAALQRFIQGKFDEAIALYHEALAVDPGHMGALRGLAMANAQANRTDEAVAWAVKLTETLPNDPMSWATLSMLLQKQGKIKEAEDAQAKARVLGWKTQLKNSE